MTELFYRHAPSLFAYFRQHTASREDAEDLLHEVFAAALEQPEFGLLSDSEQALWLWRVARNKTIDTYRRKTRRPSLALDYFVDELYAGDEQSPEYAALRSEEYAHLLAAVFFLALLIGGLLTALGVVHVGPFSPTSSITSQVITSVALSDNANQTTQTSTIQDFTVGQTVWLTSVINTEKISGSGALMVKWYENDHLYATSTHDVQASKGQAVAKAVKGIHVRIHQVFTQPGEGKVEIYWNGQLVKTLYFVVK